MARFSNLHPNVNAFLDMLAYSEGTAGKGDDGYNVIVTGVDGKLELFNDYSTHPFANGRPPKVINHKGLKSTAAGRYQFLLRYYNAYSNILANDFKALGITLMFGPEAQDLRALDMMHERNALDLIIAGKIEAAIAKVCKLWASLPGADYEDQTPHEISTILGVYRTLGGGVT